MELLAGKRYPMNNRVSRRAILCLLVMLVMTLEPAFLAAATAKTISEEQLPSLHAALVFKIAMFVEWQDDTTDSSGGKFSLAVVGNNIVFDAFESMSSKKIKGQELDLVHHLASDPFNKSHILFISSSYFPDDTPGNEANQQNIQKFEAVPAGVLTISDDPHFNARGGMIKLSIKNGRPHFTINIEAGAAAGIKFSSKLLKIATIYVEETS